MAESPPPTKDRRTFAAKQASAEEWHDFERIRLANEIAAAILYLASDESAFTTGAELVIDGGLTAQ